jgi:hypothetical protein
MNKLQDEQRIERLRHCRELEEVLKQCETQKDYNSNTMEEFPGGLRRMKYFGWRGVLKNDNNASDAMPEKLRQAMETSCARERHAVWACRAVAVGCGKELGALKACFDEQGSFAILHQPQTAYELSEEKMSTTTNIPCAKQQAALGANVRLRANELLQRQQQRQSDSTAQQ